MDDVFFSLVRVGKVDEGNSKFSLDSSHIRPFSRAKCDESSGFHCSRANETQFFCPRAAESDKPATRKRQVG